MFNKIILSCLLVMFAIGSAHLVAQQKPSSIQGRFTDTAGKPMPNIHVVARNAASGEEHNAKTNENGEFNFGGLEAGRYVIQDIGAPSSSGSSATVPLAPNSSKSLALQEDNTGKIQIQAETVLASSETAAIKNEFTEKPIELFPQPNSISKNGAAFGAYNLSLLGEAVTPGSVLQNGIGPSVAGQRNSSNNFEVNGIDNNNPAMPGPLLAISNEAVTNFTIEQGESVSQLDHSSGGQLNVILAQGANLWHGGIYDYLNTRKLNAVEPALADGFRKQRYDQNRMGFTADGPIVHDKLFAFVNFEYLPLRSDRVQLAPVFAPTAAGYATASSIAGVSSTNLSALQNTIGTAQTATLTTTVGGATIPLGPVNTDIRTSTDQFNGLVNIDWHIGLNSKLALRYGHNDMGTNAFGSTMPAFAVPGHTRSLLGELNYTGAFGSGMTLSANAGYNRYDQAVGGGSLSFPGLTSFPNININELGLTLGSNLAADRIRTNTYQFGGWADQAINRHHVRFGMDVRFLESVFGNLSSASGSLAYSNLNRFLLDLPPDAGAQQTFGTTAFVGDRSVWTAFVQDRLRVRGVALELGVKYQYSQLPLSIRRQSEVSSLNVPGLVSFNEPRPDRNNFAPDIGIAWSPGSERTTIRSSVGMLYDTNYGNPSLLAADMTMTTLTNSTLRTPGFLASGGLPAPVTTAGGVGTVAFQESTPYLIQWNAGVTQALFGRLSMDVRYVGNRGVHQPFETVLNDTSGVSASVNLPVFFADPGLATLNSLGLTQQSLTASTNAFTAAGFTNPILAARSDGTSWYNAAVFKLNDRFTGGTQISGEYTYSDARSDTTGAPLDLEFGRRMEQSIWNRKHRATLTPVLDISSLTHSWSGKFRGAANSLSIIATLTYESGAKAPLFSGAATGIMGTPEGSGVFINPAGVPGTSSGVISLTNGAGQIIAFLAANPNAQFVVGGPGSFSTDRPTLQLGQTRNIDLAVTKGFAVGHWGKIETRADAFNLFNHPQFTGMDISNLGLGGGLGMVPGYLMVSSSQFNNLRGVVSGNPRTIQLALHLNF